LLLERDQIFPGVNQIYKEITKRKSAHPEFPLVNEIWFANTAGLATEEYVVFMLLDDDGLVEMLTVKSGVLKERRIDR
jgi:hypothetical protein